jgi:hypothetical protein
MHAAGRGAGGSGGIAVSVQTLDSRGHHDDVAVVRTDGTYRGGCKTSLQPQTRIVYDVPARYAGWCIDSGKDIGWRSVATPDPAAHVSQPSVQSGT